MTRKRSWAPVLTVAFVALCGSLALRATLRADHSGFAGVGVNMGSGLPIAGAKISAAGRQATTNASGRYLLLLPAGSYDVRAEAAGYIGMVHKCARLDGSGHVELGFEMVPQHPSADEASVINEKLVRPLQAPPEGDRGATLMRGYRIASVTAAPPTIRVLMPDGTAVVMEMDEYLKGVVPHEVPPHWPAEALRAQAVAARSYAATRRGHADQGADVCTTVHCQVWKPTHYDTTDQAVEDTHGVVATHEGKVIYAFFFGHCDGHTRDVEDVWGGYLPYCRSVSCPCGYDTLWGHGVGMCQEGARVLALQGQSYDEILKHYYTGIGIQGPVPGSVSGATAYPLSGDENTEFVYEATYASATGEAPAVANLVIDGLSYALQQASGTAQDGWRYRFVTTLPVGEHSYRLCFDDGYGNVARAPATGTFDGPTVAEATPGAPTPTPVPTPTGGVQADSVVHSTPGDWAQGDFAGVCVAEAGDGALLLEDQATQGTYTSAVLHAPLTFIGLGLTWQASLPGDASISFEVRTSLDGLTWGEWQPAEPSEDDPGQGDFRTSDLIFGPGAALQYRVELLASSDGGSPVLSNLRLVCIDSRAGPSAAELAAGREHVAGEPPPVVARSEWGADESIRTWEPEYRIVRAVVVHHTGTECGGVDPAAVVRAIYYYHAVVRGWGDIGYNYLVDHLGNIYEGRAGGVGVVGAHAGRFNWGSLGMALIGDYHQSDPPDAMLDGLAEFLAWQCVEHFLDPASERPFIDMQLPTVMGHRDCASTICPGDRAYALLPSIRSQIREKTAYVPPKVRLASPGDGQAVRAVVDLSLEVSPVITRVDYYVDGELQASDEVEPFAPKWNTLEEAETEHLVRVVVHNSAGQSEDEVRVRVDNTPPSGSASVPPWSNSTGVGFVLSSPDAGTVQFSNDWVWQGEDLWHQDGTGHVITDGQALNGYAWHGRVVTDCAGAWYGPYTCDLPSWMDYQVYFRLKNPSNSADVELAVLDVADNQGHRVYLERSLVCTHFCRDDIYEEFRLDLSYQGQWPTCRGTGEDGLEFRTWFRGSGDLYLDHVAVFGQPQPLASPFYWKVRAIEGSQQVTVRFLDAAGNATDSVVTVNLDMAAPEWLSYGTHAALVQDTLSGLDTTSAAWRASQDGGFTWGDWQSISLTETPGITLPLQLAAPKESRVRFRIRDMAGNQGLSEPLPLTPTPTTHRVMMPVILKGR